MTTENQHNVNSDQAITRVMDLCLVVFFSLVAIVPTYMIVEAQVGDFGSPAVWLERINKATSSVYRAGDELVTSHEDPCALNAVSMTTDIFSTSSHVSGLGQSTSTDCALASSTQSVLEEDILSEEEVLALKKEKEDFTVVIPFTRDYSRERRTKVTSHKVSYSQVRSTSSDIEILKRAVMNALPHTPSCRNTHIKAYTPASAAQVQPGEDFMVSISSQALSETLKVKIEGNVISHDVLTLGDVHLLTARVPMDAHGAMSVEVFASSGNADDCNQSLTYAYVAPSQKPTPASAPVSTAPSPELSSDPSEDTSVELTLSCSANDESYAFSWNDTDADSYTLSFEEDDSSSVTKLIETTSRYFEATLESQGIVTLSSYDDGKTHSYSSLATADCL